LARVKALTKKAFPARSLTTAPGCNALPLKGQGPATSMALRRLAFFF